MKIIFVSDLHLSQSAPELSQVFFRFLETECKDAQRLYILGDLFEAWIGDDNNEPYGEEITHALKKCSEKTEIFIMQGNRDFLLGETFARKCGATLLNDPCVIDLYSTKTLLTHGDLLCTDDKNYQRFRSIVRFKPLQKIYLSLPLTWRLKIAHALRSESKTHVKSLSPHIMDATQSSILNMMNHYHVSQIIHGHTHQPTIQILFQHNKIYKRYVLSDWHETKANGLICIQDEAPRLIP